MLRIFHLLVCVGVAAVTLTFCTVGYVATRPARQLFGEMQLDEALRETVAAAAEVDSLEQAYFARYGEYAGEEDLERVVPGGRAARWEEIRAAAGFRTSPVKSGYVVVVHARTGRLECAAYRDRHDAPRFAALPGDEVRVELGGWDVLPDGTIECRKTGLAWRLLHVIGLGYVPVPRME